MGIYDLLNKMEDAEADFLETEFLAPILPGGKVRVRIAGMVCELDVKGASTQDWAILKPLSMETAQIVSKPGLGQIRNYLELFPALRLLLLSRDKDCWWALPANRGDSRFQTDGPVRVRLVADGSGFRQIIARFDGGHFWFQEIDRKRNPAIAAYLSNALSKGTAPDNLRKPTLRLEEREAYQILFRATVEAKRDRTEKRLSDALGHAGARLSSYIERRDAYTVSFRVDGHSHTSTVRKDDLTLVSAGICLSGGDRNFDLQSLVGVIREGRQRDQLVEEDYYD